MSSFFSTLESFKNIYMFVCVNVCENVCVSVYENVFVFDKVWGYTCHSMYVVLRGQHCRVGSLLLWKVLMCLANTFPFKPSL